MKVSVFFQVNYIPADMNRIEELNIFVCVTQAYINGKQFI